MIQFYIPKRKGKRLCVTIDVGQFFIALLLFALATSALFFTMTFNGEAETTQKYEIVSVEKGDTVWSIAQRHAEEGQDVRRLVNQIQQVNHINGAIHPAQKLKVPLE